MKRLPLFLTVAAVVLLSVSLAYWGLQLFKPRQRAIAAPPAPPVTQLNLDAAKGLFGGQIAVAAVSNYQLKGVVAARGNDSAAILSVDNKPAVALAVGKEVVPGVVVKEVHPKFVLLSEGGVIKRVDLASDAGVSSGTAPMPGQLPVQPQPQPQPQPPSIQQSPPQPPVQPQNPPQGQRSSVSPTTIAPVPGFDRQQ